MPGKASRVGSDFLGGVRYAAAGATGERREPRVEHAAMSKPASTRRMVAGSGTFAITEANPPSRTVKASAEFEKVDDVPSHPAPP